MAAQTSSVVEQVVAHCANECFTGLLRVRSPAGDAEFRFLSGIQDSAQFGSLEGDEVVDRLAAAGPLEFQVIPRLPPLDGATEEVPQQGELSSIDAAALMRYCESNSLTCTLELEVGPETLTATYQFGELLSLEPDSESAAEMAVATEGRYRFRLPPVELPEFARPTSMPRASPVPRATPKAKPAERPTPRASPGAPAERSVTRPGQVAGAFRAGQPLAAEREPTRSPSSASRRLPAFPKRPSERPAAAPRSSGQGTAPTRSGTSPGATPRPRAQSTPSPFRAGQPGAAARVPGQPGLPAGATPSRPKQPVGAASRSGQAASASAAQAPGARVRAGQTGSAGRAGLPPKEPQGRPASEVAASPPRSPGAVASGARSAARQGEAVGPAGPSPAQWPQAASGARGVRARSEPSFRPPAAEGRGGPASAVSSGASPGQTPPSPGLGRSSSDAAGRARAAPFGTGAHGAHAQGFGPSPGAGMRGDDNRTFGVPAGGPPVQAPSAAQQPPFRQTAEPLAVARAASEQTPEAVAPARGPSRGVRVAQGVGIAVVTLLVALAVLWLVR